MYLEQNTNNVSFFKNWHQPWLGTYEIVVIYIYSWVFFVHGERVWGDTVSAYSEQVFFFYEQVDNKVNWHSILLNYIEINLFFFFRKSTLKTCALYVCSNKMHAYCLHYLWNCELYKILTITGLQVTIYQKLPKSQRVLYLGLDSKVKLKMQTWKSLTDTYPSFKRL